MNRSVGLFAEDAAHEKFIEALIIRLSREYHIKVSIDKRSATGGHGKVVTQYRQYLRDLRSQGENYYDLVVVGTDANCQGLLKRLKQMKNVEKKCPGCNVIYAVLIRTSSDGFCWILWPSSTCGEKAAKHQTRNANAICIKRSFEPLYQEQA